MEKCKEVLIRKIKDKIFGSEPGAPTMPWYDEIKPYIDILERKSIEDLQRIFARIQNWSWKATHHIFMEAVVNENPFRPLADPENKNSKNFSY